MNDKTADINNIADSGNNAHQSEEEQHRNIQLNLAQRFLDSMKASDYIMHSCYKRGAEIPDACDIKMRIMEEEPNIITNQLPRITYDIIFYFNDIMKSDHFRSMIDVAWSELDSMIDNIAKKVRAPRRWSANQTHSTDDHGTITVKVVLEMNPVS